MADRARSFVAKFLSDLSRFQTDDAARGLDDVAGRGEDAGRALSDVERSSDDAGRALETAGRAADDSSRRLDDVAAGAEDAGRGLDDVAGRAQDVSTRLDEAADGAEDAGRRLGDVQDGADDAARGLDEVAVAGRSSVAGLDDVAAASREAATDVEKVGKSAEDTARDTDAAFDRIKAASRSGLRSVGDEADRADEKLGDVRDEAVDTAREMGASFSGSADDVSDAFQEVAANALQSFGIVGTAAGVVAAVGIGVLRAESERLREASGELAGELIDGGGRLERDSVLAKLRGFAEDGSIRQLAEQAERAQVPVADFLLAAAGDPDALERTTRLTADLTEETQAAAAAAATGAETMGGFAPVLTDQQQALKDVNERLTESGETYALATEAAAAYDEAARATSESTGLQAETLGALTTALEGAADPLSAYTEALGERQEAERAAAEATAESTGATAEDVQAMVDAATVSYDDYVAKLQEQVTAQEEWAGNMQALAGRVSETTLEQLARLGPEGAPLVADLVNRSDGELARLDDLHRRHGAAAADALVGEIEAAAQPAADAGYSAGKVSAEQYAEAIGGQSAAVRYRAGKLAQDAAEELERSYHPVITPVLNMTPLRQSLSQELTARAG